MNQTLEQETFEEVSNYKLTFENKKSYDDLITEDLDTQGTDELSSNIEDNNIEAVAQPEIDVKEISAETGVVFTAKVTVKPEFELGTYKGVEVSKITHRTTEKEINGEIQKVREQVSLIFFDSRI